MLFLTSFLFILLFRAKNKFNITGFLKKKKIFYFKILIIYSHIILCYPNIILNNIKNELLLLDFISSSTSLKILKTIKNN